MLQPLPNLRNFEQQRYCLDRYERAVGCVRICNSGAQADGPSTPTCAPILTEAAKEVKPHTDT